MKQYRQDLQKQFTNLDIPGISELYSYLYSFVKDEFTTEDEILEIGAALGASKKFLSNLNVLRTDVIVTDNGNVIGSIDVHKLPFQDNRFDGVFALDAIHHCVNPELALKEMMRVCKIGGKIVLIEPFVSPLSFLFYKLFHREDVSWKLDPEKLEGIVDNSPESGNQAIMQALLNSKFVSDRIQKGILKVLKYQQFAPLSLYLTGGINRPLPIGAPIIKAMLNFERRIPNRLMRVVASRQILVFQVNSVL